jgi:hypothetical protein
MWENSNKDIFLLMNKHGSLCVYMQSVNVHIWKGVHVFECECACVCSSACPYMSIVYVCMFADFVYVCTLCMCALTCCVVSACVSECVYMWKCVRVCACMCIVCVHVCMCMCVNVCLCEFEIAAENKNWFLKLQNITMP